MPQFFHFILISAQVIHLLELPILIIVLSWLKILKLGIAQSDYSLAPILWGQHIIGILLFYAFDHLTGTAEICVHETRVDADCFCAGVAALEYCLQSDGEQHIKKLRHRILLHVIVFFITAFQIPNPIHIVIPFSQPLPLLLTHCFHFEVHIGTHINDLSLM